MAFPTFTSGDVLTAANLSACFTIPLAKIIPANLTVAHGTLTQVDFASATVSYDTHSMVDTANDRFVIPTGWGGYYRIYAKTLWDQRAVSTGSDGDRSLAVYVNGAQIDQDQRHTVADEADIYFDNTLRVVTAPLALAAGDLITFKVFHNRGTGLNETITGSRSYYAVEYVRPLS